MPYCGEALVRRRRPCVAQQPGKCPIINDRNSGYGVSIINTCTPDALTDDS
jgi:hypothetical protein